MENEIMEKRKENVLNIIYGDEYKPMKVNEMAYLLDISKEERQDFNDLISELKDNGDIVFTKKGKIMTLESMNLVKGVFQGHMKGFGFVMPDNTRTRDVFIPREEVHGAMQKDIVIAEVTREANDDSRAEGKIVKILSRGKDTIVGTYEKSQNFGFVVPDDEKIANDIFITKKESKGAVSGHKVLVQIIKYPKNEDKNPEGKIIEILGHKNDPGVDILSIIRDHNIPDTFPQEVLMETEKITDKVSKDDYKNRTDLRDLLTITIDGEDAKDLDDAITLEKKGDIYSLGVHIADVTNYVREGSKLDTEALKRGNSVYLVDRVIPMLPHKLSNGICSLNANEDRLALSCLMDVDKNGKVISFSVENTVINVDKRLSYTGVFNALNGDDFYTNDYKDFIPMLENARDLMKILQDKRHRRGAIEFDFKEAQIIVDEKGKPIDIVLRERNFATQMIEEFMILANETIAESYHWMELPFIYRVHEKPSEEKMDELSEFIGHFGESFKGQDIYPKDIQKLLEEFEGKPEKMLISRVVLRSLRQAKYDYENEGHFGLASDYYSHFTSPIRRYADLQIHRIIKDNIAGNMKKKKIEYYDKILPEVCSKTSKSERLAEDCEREVDDMKKAEFMEDKIGEVFEGTISGVTNWGIYVELPNTVEGMIRLENIEDDYYNYDNESLRLIGEHTGRTFNLGEKVTVQLVSASKESRQIDFILIEEDEKEEK